MRWHPILDCLTDAPGIGVVEGIMTLVFTSLGIPAAVAATVTLAFRGLTFWLPMFFYRVHHIAWMRSFGVEETVALGELECAYCRDYDSLMGGINILSAVTPALTERVPSWNNIRLCMCGTGVD